MKNTLKQKIRNFCFVSVVGMSSMAGALSCSKTAFNGGVEARLEVLVGDSQIISPRETAKIPIEFQFVDGTGAPVPGAPVDLALLDVGKISGELTADSVRLALKEKTTETSDAFDEVDNLGRIDGAKRVRTDTAGRVLVNVIAPSRFGARVALVASTPANSGLPDLLAFAVFTTPSSNDLGIFALESSYDGNVVPAGRNVDFWITLRDQRGALVTTYEGDALFSFSGTSPGASWLGLQGSGFKTEVTCKFIAGRCVLAGGPYNFTLAQELKYKIKGLKPIAPEFEATVVVKPGSKPTNTVMADRVGGDATRARPLTSITMVAGERVDIAAAWVDDGGNWLGDATDARWTSNVSEFQALLPVDARAAFSLRPTLPALFKIELDSPSGGKGSVIPVEIKSGELVGWRVSTMNGGKETAGRCFRLNIEGIDTNGNVVPTMDGIVQANISITGLIETPPALNDVAHFDNLGNRIIGTSLLTNVVFSYGKATPNESICLYDATGTAPIINFSSNGMTASTPVIVNLGPPSLIKISREDTGEIATNACTTPPMFVGDLCRKFTFEADELNPPSTGGGTTSPINLYTTITDSAGNFIRPADVKWQMSGALLERNPLLSHPLATLETFIHTQPLYPVRMGNGTFVLSVADSSVPAQAFDYEVKHGRPVQAKVETQSQGIEKAGQAFTVSVSLFDKWGNATINHSSRYANAKVTALSVLDAPNGEQGQYSFDWDMNFSNVGKLVSDSTQSQTLSLKCICMPNRIPSIGLDCKENGNVVTNEMRSGRSCPTVSVNIPGVGPGTFYSAPLTIAGEQLNQLKFRDTTGGLGEDLAIKHATESLQQEIFRPLTMAIAGYDRYGNYLEDVVSALTWRWTSLVPPSENPSFKPFDSAPQVVSKFVGTGKLTAGASSTIIADSPPITFKNSGANRYAIKTNHMDESLGVPVETAGLPFKIFVLAIDPLGYVDTDFSGVRKFKFEAVTSPSWTGQVPYLPIGREYTCTFASGECEIVPDAGNAGWLLSDASRPVVLSVVETTTGVTILPGTFATTLQILKGVAQRLVVADKAGGPATGALVMDYFSKPLLVSIDDITTISTALVDSGGNYLQDEANPTHIFDSNYGTVTNTNSIVTLSFKKITEIIDGTKTSKVLTLGSATGGISPLQFDVKIFHGQPAKLDVQFLQETSTQGVFDSATTTLKAGNCYEIRTTVLDAQGNLVDSLNGAAVQMLIGLRGNLASAGGFVMPKLNFNGGLFTPYNSFESANNWARMASFTPPYPDLASRTGYPAGTPNPRRYSDVNHYQAGGGFTSATQTGEKGILKPSVDFVFCPALTSAAAAGTNYSPRIDVEMTYGSRYKNKLGLYQDFVPTVGVPVTGTSPEITIVPGPAALVGVREKRLGPSGVVETLNPVCAWFGSRVNVSGYSYGSIETTNLARSFVDTNVSSGYLNYKACNTLDVDYGGVFLFAEVTDLAGNFVRSVASGTMWNVTEEPCRDRDGNKISCNISWVKTSDTLQDNFSPTSTSKYRPAGEYEVVVTEPSLNMTANIRFNVTAGRPAKISTKVSGISASAENNEIGSTSVTTDEAAYLKVTLMDAWGNGACQGSTTNVSVQWTNPQNRPFWPPLVPVYMQGNPTPLGPLVDPASGVSTVSGFETCTQGNQTNWFQNPSSKVAYFHSPQAGNWGISISSQDLIDVSRPLNLVGGFEKQSTFNYTTSFSVQPGKLKDVRPGYSISANNYLTIPVTEGPDFDAVTEATAGQMPYTLQSYNSISTDGRDFIGVYLKGYDNQGNYWGLVSSQVSVVTSALHGNEVFSDSRNCTSYSTTILCSPFSLTGRSGVNPFSVVGSGSYGDLVHAISGTKTGTIVLRLTSTEYSFSTGTPVYPSAVLPAIRVVPGRLAQLRPIEQSAGTTRFKNSAGQALVNTQVQFKIAATDINGNLQNWNENHYMEFSFTGGFDEPNDEEVKNVKPKNQNYMFTGGISDSSFLVNFKRAGYYKAKWRETNYQTEGALTAHGNWEELNILPLEFHHYGTTAAIPESGYFPDSSGSTKFSAAIELRDINGNPVDASTGPGRTVSLSIVREDGTTPSGSGDLGGNITGITLSGLSTTVPNMSYRQSGKFKLIATDSASVATPLAAAKTIEMKASLGLVSRYTIAPATFVENDWRVNAGTWEWVYINAVDSYGDVVAGIDATLDAFTFRWSGPSQANDSLQTAPILPSSLRFYSGQAWADLRFFKAESLAANALTIRDSLSGGRQGSYPKPIIVSPGPVHEYQILSSHSARKAENSTDGRFDLTIKLFDEWRNPAPGPAGLKLAAEKITGPGDVSGVFTSAGEFANTSRETSLFNMDSEITFSDVWYPVGHRVQFKLMNVQVALAQPVEMNFEYTPLSIRNYKLIFSNATFTAGTLQTMTMKALDYANNVITTLDSQLNERTLTFSGAGTSPNNTAPLFGSAVWVNGVASREMRLYKSERIGKSTFVVSDNAGIEGENENSLDVIEAAVQASGVVIPSDGGSIPQQVAGVPFSLTAKTVDAFGNLSDIGCSAGIALSVPTGTGTSTGGWGGDATNSIPFSISKIPGKGYYSLNGMTLFKSGTQSLTLNACGFTSATKSVVVRTAPVNRMVLSDSSAVPASDDLGLTGNSSSVERTCSNTSSATAETNCGTVYSFFWDAFGNRIDPTGSSCEWSWNNPTAQHSLDIKSPNNLAGQGSSRTVSSADFVDGTLSCSRDGVTKSIKYWGGVANLEATAEFTDLSNTIITSSNVPAGTKMVIQGIKVSASKNGELVPLPASEIIAAKQFTITRAVVLDSMPTNPTCILANSTTRSECGSTFTGYLRTAATAGNITLSLNGKNVVWGRSVDAGPASQIDVSSVPANATAGIALSNVTVVMKDQFGNPTNTWINGSTSAQCSTIGFGIDTATYTSSGKNGGQAVAPTADPPNPLVQSNPGEYKSTITLYKTGPTTVSFAGCGVSNTKIIAVSPNVARIGFLSTAANDTSVTAETTSYECSLTSNSPTNSNVNCGSIKAYYWDDWGNSLNGGSPVSCSWNYTNFPTGLTAATVPTTTFTGGTATLTATDFIDGTLSCSKDLKVASISNIYGGLSKINVSSTTPATLQGATLTAATGNVTFTGLTLYQRRGGFDVATRPLVQSSTLSKIHVDTGSSQNNFLKIVSVTESGRDTTNSIVTRTFATNGVTSDALNLNYTAASTSNALTLRIQGKTLSYTGITVNPGNAHAFVLPTLSAKTAGSQFSFDVEIQDIHLNRTSKNTSGSECTTPLSLSGSGASPAGNNPNYGTSSIASTGLHSISNVVLYRASASESLSVSGCGLSPATVSVIVNPASAATGVLRTTAGAVNTAESEVKCPMHASNNQLDCSSKTVYAYFWDTYGNNLTGSYGNCDSWSFDPQTRPDAINIATTAAASVTLGNKGTNTYVDGAISCTKSPLATPLSITAWGGVKEVRIVARSAANTDITSTNPTLTAASGNLAISAVNLRTTKSGVDTPSPISESRTLTWNSTATNGNGWGTGGTGATLQRGLAQQPSVTFANGSLSTADSYSAATYKFNLIKAENAKTISATVYGITSNSIAFSVQPAAANKVLLTSFNSSTASSLPALTAGTPFNIEAEVQDLYANRTTTSAAAGNPSCASDNLTVDLPAGQTRSSPGNSSNSVGTTGTFSAVSTAPTSGVYQPSNITLYNTSNTQLTLAACGVTTPYTLTVAPATVTNMVVNTNTSSVDTTALNEYECENNSTTGVVQCVELQARFWDNWGNLRADTCDTWSYVTTDTAPTPSNLTAAISNVSSVTPTHSTATYFNGQLTCTRASLSRTIRLWGGVSTVTVTHNVSGSSIVAGVGNVQVSRVTVQTPKAGNLTAPTKNLSKTIRFMSNSTGAYLQNGQDGLQLTNTSSSPAIKSCTFSGSTVLECNVSSAPYLLNFTAAQTAVTFDVSVHGVAATQSSFNVNAGTAATVAVSAAPPTTVTAGNAFGLSLLVTDDQGNPTATGCPGSVIVTGPTTSPNDGPTGTTSTSFSTSTGVTGLGSQSMPGVYTISGLKLFDARTTQTLNISACGLNATTSPNITVKAASPAVSRITTADARSTTSDSEMICNNSTTSPFAVSCGSAYAWFWDAYGNQITSSSKTAGTNDDVCTSWSFTGVTTPTANPSGYSASGAANSRFSGITNSSNQKWLDGTLTCNKTGASAALTVWGGVKSVAITAQDSGNNAITSSTNLTAAVGNLKITNITLNAQKAGNTVVASHVSGATYGTRTIYWNTNAVALSGAANSGWSTSGTGVNTPFGQNSSVSLSFSNGINTGTHNFNFVKADSTARTIAAGIFGSDFATSIQSTAVTFNSVLPATASALFATAGSTTVTTAGGSVSVSVTAKDEFGNLTSTGCTTATLGETATGNLSSPGGSTAVFPGALALGSIGTFNSGSVILKKVGSGQIIRASACGLTADTSGITVQNADSLNNILLSTSSSAQPAYNTSLPTTTCTSGTTVACPAVSAWGEDQFGNGRGLVTCGTWTYSPTSPAAAATLSQTTSSNTTTVTNSNTHVNGTLTCTIGALTKAVTLTGSIVKSPTLTCSAWTCSAGAPQSTCTFNNGTGYDIASMTVTPTPNSGCSGSLANGSNCTLTFPGTTGQSLGDATVVSTPSAPSFVSMNNAVAAIAGNTNAPNCSQSLRPVESAWSCVSGIRRLTVTFHNDNTLNAFNIAAGSPSITNANGATITNNGCSSSIAAGGSCSVTIEGTTTGNTTTLQLDPEASSSFSGISFTTTQATNTCP